MACAVPSGLYCIRAGGRAVQHTAMPRCPPSPVCTHPALHTEAGAARSEQDGIWGGLAFLSLGKTSCKETVVRGMSHENTKAKAHP